MNLNPSLRWLVSLLFCGFLTSAHAQDQYAQKLLQGLKLDEDIRAAIASGDARALSQQGARLEHGEGVPRSADGAVALYCMAARQGHHDAQYALGWMYANGRGVGRNDALAAAWFQLAAEAKDQHSTRMLRRLGATAGTPARCLLADGTELLPPLLSAANPSRQQVVYWVHRLAPSAGIDPNLVLSVIEVESAFNARAKSPKNARGLMQLLPVTARRFGTQNEWDPLENIRGGIAYLEWLLKRFDGNMKFALAGYNAGEGAVQKYRGIPPYKETQAYVKSVFRICKRAQRGKHRFIRSKQPRDANLERDLAMLKGQPVSNRVLATCRA